MSGSVGGEAAVDQAEIISFLMKPGSYPDRPAEVTRLDTHGAAIFLAGERAYKLKRAVKLAYLDFSTVSKRKAVCERELALNRVTAPKLYRGLVPVTRGSPSGELRLGGGGEPVDWLIEMERFDEEQLFDRLALAGRLDDGLIVALAEVVERFHAGAPVWRDTGWPASLAGVVANVARALSMRNDVPGVGDQRARTYLRTLQSTFAGHGDLLAARRDAGLVRRCHGDLHLKNIVLIDGRPCLFDALEFDEELARIDVLYDLAFLAMDLWRRDLKREANALLNHYFAREASELEWRGLALFPFFLSLRAAIRAMVGLDGLSIATGEKQAALTGEIGDYVHLAEALLRPAPARLIAIGGLSGTGKSTVARAVAPGLGAVPGAMILRSDVERKLMRGASLTAPLAPDAYAPEARDAVYQRLLTKAEAVQKSGYSVILDAVFDQPANRDAAKQLAANLGVPFEGIWLDAPKDALIARVTARAHDASDADANVVLRQIDSVVVPSDWHHADAGGDAAQTSAQVEALLHS